MSISQLGYLGFGVGDSAEWESFMTKVLGVTVSTRFDNGTVSYRNDSYKHRFFVVPDGSDDLIFVGLQVADAEALAAMIGRLESAGVDVREGTAEELAVREVEALAVFHDPAGNRLELFHGPTMADTPFESSVIASTFVADEQGLGHCVLRANTLEESEAFFIDVLGFKLSDHIRCDLGGYQVNIAFFHMNPRHHSIAIGCGLPKRIHHFMLQVSSVDDLGMAFDRTIDAGHRVVQTIGRHPNDRMVSFYAQSPSGFEFEYGWGAIEIDDATWETTTYGQVSEWGHRRPPYRRPKN